MSLMLQAAFGLRREESIKFPPRYAARGDLLSLKPSWSYGGRTRDFPILSERQRDVLHQAHHLAGKGALIPYHRKYSEQLRIYERQTARAGLSKLHGLRHQYAQTRYQTLTGWPAPAASRSGSDRLTPEQKQIDHEARLTVSRELGRAREQVTAVYLGR